MKEPNRNDVIVGANIRRTLRIAGMIDKLEPTDRDAVTRLVMTLSSKNATEKAA